MAVRRQRAWAALLALVAVLGSPLPGMVCCDEAGPGAEAHAHGHLLGGHHAHDHLGADVADATAHGAAAAPDRRTREPAAVAPEDDCPRGEVPPALLALEDGPKGASSAGLAAPGVSRSAARLRVHSTAGAELRSRAPPRGGRRILADTCSLLI